MSLATDLGRSMRNVKESFAERYFAKLEKSENANTFRWDVGSYDVNANECLIPLPAKRNVLARWAAPFPKGMFEYYEGNKLIEPTQEVIDRESGLWKGHLRVRFLLDFEGHRRGDVVDFDGHSDEYVRIRRRAFARTDDACRIPLAEPTTDEPTKLFPRSMPGDVYAARNGAAALLNKEKSTLTLKDLVAAYRAEDKKAAAAVKAWSDFRNPTEADFK